MEIQTKQRRQFPRHLMGLGGRIGRGHPEIDRRSLARARLVVAHVDANPKLIKVGIDNVKRWMRRTDRQRNACDVEWLQLITERPWQEVRALLLAESEEGQRLRSSQPFAGILTDAELRSTR